MIQDTQTIYIYCNNLRMIQIKYLTYSTFKVRQNMVTDCFKFSYVEEKIQPIRRPE